MKIRVEGWWAILPVPPSSSFMPCSQLSHHTEWTEVGWERRRGRRIFGNEDFPSTEFRLSPWLHGWRPVRVGSRNCHREEEISKLLRHCLLFLSPCLLHWDGNNKQLNYTIALEFWCHTLVQVRHNFTQSNASMLHPLRMDACKPIPSLSRVQWSTST